MKLFYKKTLNKYVQEVISVCTNHIHMPLKSGKSKKAMAYNFHELKEDNKKEGKEKGAGGKPRSRAQMIAIVMSKAGKSKTSKRK